jgi:hypothetical protein
VLSATVGAQTNIAGVVREDSTGRAVVGAEITVDSLPRMTLSDAAGRFTMRDFPAGAHRIHVRMAGYRPFDVDEQFVAGSTVSVAVSLAKLPHQLDAVAVIEPERASVSRGFAGFEARRKQGLGKFIGTDQLRENDQRRLEDVLNEVRGLKIVSPPACPSNSNRMTCEPNGAKRIATVGGCPVQIAIDGALVYRGRSGAIDWPATFDLTDLAVASLAGIEVYRSETEVPASLAAPGTTCGMIAFWLRRD